MAVGQGVQLEVAVSLANSWASLPIAWALYLPRAWAEDKVRRKKAGVPEQIEFRTKAEIALAQIEAAVKEGLELGVIVADAAFGDETDFRDGVRALGLPYCVGIRERTTVWPVPSAVWSGSQPSWRRDEQHQPVSVEALAWSLPAQAFRRVSWREGARGKLSSWFAAVRVRAAHRDNRRSKPQAEEWLLVEWPTGAPAPTHYWHWTLPAGTSLKKLVYFAKLRWRIERDYQDLKQESGLGHYEGRKWRGFHHHATMCIAAYAFLVAERGLFPLEALDAHLDSTNLAFPSVSHPDSPPLRPERHNPTSIATLRQHLIVVLVRRLQRCPCCRPNTGTSRERGDELIE